MYSSTLSLTSALDGGGWSTLGRLYHRKRAGTHYMRVGELPCRSALVRKISPPPEFDPRTAQPVASRHTD